MAKSRPTSPQLRARQRAIVEYLASTDQSVSRAAREFGVKPAVLRRFLSHEPQQLRRYYNRSPAYSALYEAGGRAHRRDIVPMARARKVTIRRETIATYKKFLSRRTRATKLFQRRKKLGQIEQWAQPFEVIAYQYGSREPEALWSKLTFDRGLPRSIRELRLLHEAGDIDDDEWDYLIERWREIYSIVE